MWRFCRKEEPKEIEQPKELIIKKRIASLYDKMYLIYDACNDKNCKHILYSNSFRAELWFQYKLDTIYGTRYILVNTNKNKLFYGKDFKFDHYIAYRSYPEIDFTRIFEINVQSDNELIIEPKPMVELTPEEIDLAILEFENAIEKSYQIAKTMLSNHEKCIEYFKKESNL